MLFRSKMQVSIYFLFMSYYEKEREREAYNCVIWQMVPLLKVQSHLIDGLLIGSSKSISFKAVPLYGSPLMFHNATACASHCWNTEIKCPHCLTTHNITYPNNITKFQIPNYSYLYHKGWYLPKSKCNLHFKFPFLNIKTI